MWSLTSPPPLQVYLDPQSPKFFPKSWNPGEPCTCLRPDLLTSRDDSNGSAVFGKWWWAGSWTTPSHGKKTHTQKGGCKCVYIYTSISTYIYTYIKIFTCIHIYIYTLILSWYPKHPLFQQLFQLDDSISWHEKMGVSPNIFSKFLV